MRAVAAPGPAAAGLGSAMREEVWTIVRAAVEEAMGPIVARQRELEARVERAERAVTSGAAARAAAPVLASPMAASTGGSIGNSIPVAFGPSLAPPAAAAPKPARMPSFDQDTTTVNGTRGPMASLPPQGYGVAVIKSTRPELDLSSVGPVDIEGFDGGRSKRRVATAVVVLMLMIIGAVVTMTVLSHS
jgi:hypothetical protein